MNRRRSSLMAGIAATAVLGVMVLSVPSVADASPAVGRITAACAAAPVGMARCFAQYRIAGVRAAIARTPDGYGPAELRSAYGYPATGGDGQTVGIVDANDDPSAETDLAAYRARYGLPACTTGNGCFRKVNQLGRTTALPAPNGGWATEISLDLDMVSAACPACHILLVEADGPSLENLGASVDTAVRLGATVVSNSYGAAEDSMTGVLSFRGHYRHPGVPMIASSGDSGFGAAAVPAVYSTVIAVGGTTLRRADNARGWTESAWSQASSGCSAWVRKPAWQRDRHCHMRTVADVSADADPNTGVAVYDTYLLPGWLVAGGTSASAPFVAAGIALAGNGSSINNASSLYHHRSAFHDITSGSTSGPDCGGDYLCTAGPGYDGPTGVGTPNGLRGL